jgi:hypothetical protein
VQAKFGIKQAEIQSKERIKGVEIAVEDKRAKDAATRGVPEEQAVGVGVG